MKVQVLVRGGGTFSLDGVGVPQIGEAIELRTHNEFGAHGEAAFYRVKDVVRAIVRNPGTPQTEPSITYVCRVLVSRISTEETKKIERWAHEG